VGGHEKAAEENGGKEAMHEPSYEGERLSFSAESRNPTKPTSSRGGHQSRSREILGAPALAGLDQRETGLCS
jgi:hypothetical protein